MASGAGATLLTSATGDVIDTEPSEDWLSFVLEPGLGQDSFVKPLECSLGDGNCGSQHMEAGQMGSGKEDGGVGLDFFDASDGLEDGAVLPADDGLSWLSECTDFEVPPPSSTLTTAVAPFAGSLDLLLPELGPSSGGGDDVTRKGARPELPESLSQPSAAVLRSEGEEDALHFADTRLGHASDKGRGDIGTGSDSSNQSAGTSPSSAGSGVRERGERLCHGQGAYSGLSEWQGSPDRENGCADSPYAALSAKRSTPEPHTPSHYGRSAEDRGVVAALDAPEKKQQQPQQSQCLASADRASTSKASAGNVLAGKAGAERHVSSPHHASSSTVLDNSPHVEAGAAGVPRASPYCVTPGTSLTGHPLPMGYMPVHMPGHGGYAMPSYVRPSIPYPILPPPRGATRKAQRQRARAKAQAEASGAHGADAGAGDACALAGAGAPARAATTTPDSSVSLAECSKHVTVKAESETVGVGGDGGSSSSSKAEDPGSDNSEEGEGAGDRDKDKEKEAGDEDCDKRQARLIRNRESAHLSRQRRKYYMEELESQLRTMTATVAELNNTIAHLTAENVNLRRQLAFFCPPAGMPAAGMGGTPGGLPAAPAYGAAPGGSGGPVAGGPGQHTQVPGMHPGMMMGGHPFPPGMPPAMMGYRSFFQPAPPVPIPKLKSSKPDDEDKKNKKRKSGEAVGRDGGGQSSTQQQACSPVSSSTTHGASGAVKAQGAWEEDVGSKSAAAGGAGGKREKGAAGGGGRKRVKGAGVKAPATVGLLSVVGLIMILCPLFPPPLNTWNAGSHQGLRGRFAGVLPGLPWGNTREVAAPGVGEGEAAAASERMGGRGGGAGGRERGSGGGNIDWPSTNRKASGAAARHRGGGRVLMSKEEADHTYRNSTAMENTHNSPIILRANSTLNQIWALAGGRLNGLHSVMGYVPLTKNRASSQHGLGPTEGTDATATSTRLRGQGPDEGKRFREQTNVSHSTTKKEIDWKQEKEQMREQQQQQAVIPGNALALQGKQTEAVPVRPTEPKRRFETLQTEKGAVVKAVSSALPPARLPLEMSAQQLALLKALAVRAVGAAGQGHRESISGTSAAGRSSRGTMWALPPVASGDKGSASEGTAGAEGAQEQQQEKPLFSWPLGSFIGSDVCTEVFQFDVGGPTPSPPAPAAQHQPGNHSGANGTLSCGGQGNSTHMANNGRAMPRRFGRSHRQKSPALPSVEPLGGKVVRKGTADHGPSGEVDVWRGGTIPESKANGSGAGEQSSVVVSILAGLDDEVARGLQGASKGTPSIFVVVLVNGVRYITYACLLPAFSGKTGGSVMPV